MQKNMSTKSIATFLATLLLLGSAEVHGLPTSASWIGRNGGIPNEYELTDGANWNPATLDGGSTVQATIPDFSATPLYAPLLTGATIHGSVFAPAEIRFTGEQTVTLGTTAQTQNVEIDIGATGVTLTTISPATFSLMPNGFSTTLTNAGTAGGGGPLGSVVNYNLAGSSATNATFLTLNGGQSGNTLANVAMIGSYNTFTTGGDIILNDVTSGAGSDSIVLGGVLTMGSNNTDTVDGVISDKTPGSGALNMVGAGMLVLTNSNNTYSKGTTITNGTVQISGVAGSQLGTGPLIFDGGTLKTTFVSGYTLNNPVSVTSNDGTLDLDGYVVIQGTTATLTGPGQLLIKNSGTPHAPFGLTLDNSGYNGTLKVDSTSVLVGVSSVKSIPSVDIINNGVVQFNQGVSNVVYSGDMSGLGSVIIGNVASQPGTSVQFTGTNNTYTGGTIIVGGSSLIGNGNSFPQNSYIIVNAVNTDTLDFAQTSNNTYAGTLLGYGTITTQGSGTNKLYLTGNSSAFAGTTTIPEGEVNMNTNTSALGGNINVSGTGILSGVGTIGGKGFLTSVTGGTVKPGNSPGILTNAGDYSHIGGTLKIDISGQGNVAGVNNSELVVEGVTTLAAAAAVQVNSLDGSFYIGDKYTILSSANTLTGAFAPTVVTNTTLTPTIVYEGNDVLLDFQNPFLGCAYDYNGQNVAQQLFSIQNPNADEDTLLMEITSLECEDIGRALDDLSGSQYADLLLSNELSTRQFVRRLYDPLRTFLAKDLSCIDTECCCDQGLEAWIEAGGLQSNFKGKAIGQKRQQHYHIPGEEKKEEKHKSNKHGFRNYGYEITAGVQMECENTWVGGLALSYEHTNSKYHHGGDGKTNIFMGGLYGAYRVCDFYMMGNFVIGGSETTLKRNFSIGDEEYDETGKPKNLQGIIYVELGRDFRYSSFLIQPFLGLQGGYFSYRRIREKGDEPVALEFKKRNYGTFDTRLGVHLGMDEVSSGLFMGIDLAWQYRCTELNNYLDAEFVDFGNRFRLNGVDLNANSFEAAVNLEQVFCDNWSIYMTGYWQQWSNSNAYDILGGVSYKW